MVDRDSGKISADDLLRVCAQRGEKTPSDLGYSTNIAGSYKPTTYTSDSPYKILNENVGQTRFPSQSDGE